MLNSEKFRCSVAKYTELYLCLKTTLDKVLVKCKQFFFTAPSRLVQISVKIWATLS